jgi:hypothetical protein
VLLHKVHFLPTNNNNVGIAWQKCPPLHERWSSRKREPFHYESGVQVHLPIKLAAFDPAVASVSRAAELEFIGKSIRMDYIHDTVFLLYKRRPSGLPGTKDIGCLQVGRKLLAKIAPHFENRKANDSLK